MERPGDNATQRALDKMTADIMGRQLPLAVVRGIPEGEPTFDEKQAIFQAAAPSQIITAADDAPEVTPPVTASGWECPSHGASHVVGLMSRKGRPYRKCTLCAAFERSI